MNHWIYQIEDKDDNILLSIYDNGLVYGKERGDKLFILKPSAMKEIHSLIDEYMPMFRKLGYSNEKLHPLILRIYTGNRNRKVIKIVGWNQMQVLYRIVLNPNNIEKRFKKSCNAKV